MDPQTTMEAIAEGAKATTKLGEIFEKFMNPRWTKKQADADAYADEKKLQTIRDNPDMEIMYVDGKMHARERTPEALAYRAQQRQLTESIRQEQNLENVLGVAANEVRCLDDSAVSDNPVDDDWITRLFQIVKDVNSEEMQFVWGKILAGEIEQPGSFSLRTLDVIRNITKQDAEVFQKIVPLVMQTAGSQFISSSSDILSQFGISYESILRLDECGLLNSSGMLSINLYVTNHKDASVYNKETLIHIIGTDAEEIKISFGVHALTRAGSELYKILDFTANNEYSSAFAEEIFKGNKKAKISVHKINFFSGDTINYRLAPLKTFGVENGEPQ